MPRFDKAPHKCRHGTNYHKFPNRESTHGSVELVEYLRPKGNTITTVPKNLVIQQKPEDTDLFYNQKGKQQFQLGRMALHIKPYPFFVSITHSLSTLVPNQFG